MSGETATCEAFAASTSTSRCGKAASGLITTLNPDVGTNRAMNWSVCSKICAEALISDLESIGLTIEEVSV